MEWELGDNAADRGGALNSPLLPHNISSHVSGPGLRARPCAGYLTRTHLGQLPTPHPQGPQVSSPRS